MKKFILKTRQGLYIKTWKTPGGYTRKGWKYTPWQTVEMFETFVEACKRLKKYKQGIGDAKVYFNGKEVADAKNDQFAKLQIDNPEHLSILNDYEKELRGGTL